MAALRACIGSTTTLVPIDVVLVRVHWIGDI
jgi:hypothetical protein